MQLSLSVRNGWRFRKAETEEEEAALLLNLLAVTSVLATHPTAIPLPAGQESGEPICRALNQLVETARPHFRAVPGTEEPSCAALAWRGGQAVQCWPCTEEVEEPSCAVLAAQRS